MSLPSLWGQEGSRLCTQYSAENSRRSSTTLISKHQVHWLRQDPRTTEPCGHHVVTDMNWNSLEILMLRLWTLADRTAGTVNKTRVWLHQGLRHWNPHRMYMSIQYIKKTVAGQLEIILRGIPSWSLGYTIYFYFVWIHPGTYFPPCFNWKLLETILLNSLGFHWTHHTPVEST